VLYGMADCELHAFVDADPQKNVQRLYWVQFEGYLPTRPELKHNYDSPRHANIGGMDFYLLGCPTTGNSTGCPLDRVQAMTPEYKTEVEEIKTFNSQLGVDDRSRDAARQPTVSGRLVL